MYFLLYFLRKNLLNTFYCERSLNAKMHFPFYLNTGGELLLNHQKTYLISNCKNMAVDVSAVVEYSDDIEFASDLPLNVNYCYCLFLAGEHTFGVRYDIVGFHHQH